MKPLRASDVMNAVPVDGRGRRTPQTMLLIDERDALLIEAARFFPGSDRQAAHYIRTALLRYQTGRWRRDRSEATCPVQHRGKLTAVLWMLLKVRDHVPSEPTIRRVLRGIRDPAGVLQSDV